MRNWIRLTLAMTLLAVAVVSLTPAPAAAARLRKGDCCEPCEPTVKVKLTACDPCCRRCCCDDSVCVTACIPACCTGKPTCCSGCCGLFGKRGYVTYTWECGYSVTVHFGIGGCYHVTQGYC
ncbi:MAG: hypothetical protein AB7U73_25020 [Pirellulales bacterium]